MNRRRYKIILAIVIIAAIVVWRVWFPGREFHRGAWDADFKVRHGVRQKMADRLIARHTLQSKTRVEVVDLLGEPDSSGYFREWDLVYWLGDERGFISIDSEWLVLRLGFDGRVAEYRLVTD